MRVYSLFLALVMIIAMIVWSSSTRALEGGEGTTVKRGNGLKEMVGNLCPVMGGPIDKRYSYTYKGTIYYFCCPACITKFKADPEKYIKRADGNKGI